MSYYLHTKLIIIRFIRDLITTLLSTLFIPVEITSHRILFGVLIQVLIFSSIWEP